jgi:hypothetical protein
MLWAWILVRFSSKVIQEVADGNSGIEQDGLRTITVTGKVQEDPD